MRKTLRIILSLILALAFCQAADSQSGCIIPAQTALVKTTSYTGLSTDAGKLIVFNCSSACTYTLPSTPQSPNWFVFLETIGAGTVTIAPNGLTINGSSSSFDMPVTLGSGITISTDNSNYFATNLRTTYHSCDIAFGATNAASALANGDLGPQSRVCFIPAAGTVIEVRVNADAGTPNIIVGRNRAGTVVNLTSSALATAASGGIACSETGTTSAFDATTCSATLQNTGLNKGDYLEAVSGTAGGTAKWMVAHIVYTTVN